MNQLDTQSDTSVAVVGDLHSRVINTVRALRATNPDRAVRMRHIIAALVADRLDSTVTESRVDHCLQTGRKNKKLVYTSKLGWSVQ